MAHKNLLRDILEYSQLGPSEDEQSGQSQEIEYTFYAILRNVEEQLAGAEKLEHQEQFERRIYDEHGQDRGVLRSRSIDHGEFYWITVKHKNEQGSGSIETTVEGNRQFHELTNQLANRRFRKHRYFFPVYPSNGDEQPPHYWEVDVYDNFNGETETMVKIDFELTDPSQRLPAIPFECERIINDETEEEDEKALIERFWQRVNLTD